MKKRNKPNFEYEITRILLLSSIPLVVCNIAMMVYFEVATPIILLVLLISALLVGYCAYSIHHKTVFQFRVITRLIDALIQGDYSQHGRVSANPGAADELVMSINGFARRLSEHRIDSVESQLLVRTILDHIDVAIIALNVKNEISFYNPAAEKLLLLGQQGMDRQLLAQLPLDNESFSGVHFIVELQIGRQQGRFTVHVEEFRDSGQQHKLLFITDVRILLRTEERKAWQSLVRVISHEINNSLVPIASTSQTIARLIENSRHMADAMDKDCIDDISEGLKLISERANGLKHFVESFKQVARLPDPVLKYVVVKAFVQKICRLFSEKEFELNIESDIELQIDPVQFEQVIINLIKNAIESMEKVQARGKITIEAKATSEAYYIEILDEGTGVSNPDNLFVPFYTTKKQGSGIGLVLCRQIVEGHKGRLSIVNRKDHAGCCVTIELPKQCQ